MKQQIKVISVLILVFVAGMVTMRIWDAHHLQVSSSQPFVLEMEPVEEESFPKVDLRGATSPDGVEVIGEPGELQLATESNLTPVQLEGVENIVSRNGNTYAPEEEIPAVSHGVDLGDLTHNASVKATAQAREDAQEQEPPSSIVMLAAPMEPLLIKTAEEYKTFKRRARGSYPTANFAKENVLVLESTSNLPDKVFEIQEVEEKDGKLVVKYRVNMFGLEKKTNTHSAVVIKKKDLPLELKQVI